MDWWAAGYGCESLGEWKEFGHLPVDAPQTSSRVEVTAIVGTLERMNWQTRQVAIATDSQYAPLPPRVEPPYAVT